LVPRASSTPMPAWSWPTWVVSRRRVLEAVFILLEPPSPSRRIFIGYHSLPPSLVRRIGPSNPRFLHFMGKIPRYFSYLRPSTSSISACIYFRWPIPTTNPKQSLLSTPLAHDYPVAHIFCSELLAPGRPFRALGSDTFVTVRWESNCQPPCS
jgi:hypothetical protein